ncbi:MAG: hypothetical protein K8U57_40255 [Planctomycetes bacterium]|nr:hypothetical protein [Planctomycetota bacterium]
MNRFDALWVGLKLLGTALIVAGLSEAVVGFTSLLPGRVPDEMATLSVVLEREAHDKLIRGGVCGVAGLILTLGTGLFVRLERQTSHRTATTTEQW